MKARCVIAIMTVAIILSGKKLRADEPPAAPASTAPVAAPAEKAVGSVQILKMVLCQDVKDRGPVQELNVTKVGSMVVGWTQVETAEDVTLTHRWIHEGETVSDIPLQVKGGAPYRTWSRKTISDAGNWKWQVLDPKGAVLKEVTFTAAE